MEPIQHSPLDLLHTLALGSERLPSPPSSHLSLSKSTLVRADLVSLEKCITSHFNSLLGVSASHNRRKKPAGRSANTGLCSVLQVCLSWVVQLVVGKIYQEFLQISSNTSMVCRQSASLSSTGMIVLPTTFVPGTKSNTLLCSAL